MPDIDRLRAQTPGCAHRVHLNNAGAALMPTPVVNTVMTHLQLEATTGGYEAATAVQSRLQALYSSAARLIGARPEQIALMGSATEAWNAAFSALDWQPGDRLLTGRGEYVSNCLTMLQAARRRGVSVEVVPDDADGVIDVHRLAGMVDGRVRLIALTHAPSNNGALNPARRVGEIARAAGVAFLLDACQSLGQMRVDVEELGCDFLAATGRKFLRGPRGTGFLYVRRADSEPLCPDLVGGQVLSRGRYRLRPDARRFEHFERSVACFLGLGTAVDYALELGQDFISQRCQALGQRLRELLATIPEVEVLDRGRERSAIVCFAPRKRDPAQALAQLHSRGINLGLSQSAMAPFGEVRSRSYLRASPHYYNTEAELQTLCDALTMPG
jgi:selenocysteine lyase/cysteine desulfurase